MVAVASSLEMRGTGGRSAQRGRASRRLLVCARSGYPSFGLRPRPGAEQAARPPAALTRTTTGPPQTPRPSYGHRPCSARVVTAFAPGQLRGFLPSGPSRELGQGQRPRQPDPARTAPSAGPTRGPAGPGAAFFSAIQDANWYASLAYHIPRVAIVSPAVHRSIHRHCHRSHLEAVAHEPLSSRALHSVVSADICR